MLLFSQSIKTKMEANLPDPQSENLAAVPSTEASDQRRPSPGEAREFLMGRFRLDQKFGLANPRQDAILRAWEEDAPSIESPPPEDSVRKGFEKFADYPGEAALVGDYIRDARAAGKTDKEIYRDLAKLGHSMKVTRLEGSPTEHDPEIVDKVARSVYDKKKKRFLV